jgi:hypothetical protein
MHKVKNGKDGKFWLHCALYKILFSWHPIVFCPKKNFLKKNTHEIYLTSSSHANSWYFPKNKNKKIKIVDGNSWFSGSKKLWAAKLFQLQQR